MYSFVGEFYKQIQINLSESLYLSLQMGTEKLIKKPILVSTPRQIWLSKYFKFQTVLRSQDKSV